uniref:Uncharacterized protein n=1 Tax=Branchiostoma floridae TaxID=7739 RepID=C3YVS4_BRAFL|eukprot:XP_002599596.1 hypothetical protein BRAFLDRAFT_77694 [Branchiostoma floridae]
MKTPTLVLAVVLAMAVVGDSASMETIMRQLRLLAGEKTTDDSSMTPSNEVKKAKEVEETTLDSKKTEPLDLLKKLTLTISESEPEEGGEDASDAEQKYDVEDTGNQHSDFEDAGGDGEYAEAEGADAKQNYGMGEIEEYNSASDATPATKGKGQDDAGGDADVEKISDIEEMGEKKPAFERSEINMKGSSTDGSKQTKKAVPAFLAAAAKEIGGKVVSKLGDRIAEGVVENHQEKVVSGLQNYLGNQMDKFDDEYKNLLKDTSGLAAGLNRPVEEADIQLVPRPGATMGNMYAPPGWEIRHKYKYKDERDLMAPKSEGISESYPRPKTKYLSLGGSHVYAKYTRLKLKALQSDQCCSDWTPSVIRRVEKIAEP